MCGIFGWQLGSGPAIDRTQRAIMAAILALKNDNRGGDSFGFWAPLKDKAPAESIYRGVGFASPASRHMAQFPSLMGHTRKATTGSVKADNSHPFVQGSIIGAHNGMVHNWREVQAKHKREFDVDSQHIFAHIDEGLDFSELEGYGAIEYVDVKKPKRFILCKLNSGDLNIYGLGKNHNEVKGVVWSSDKEHLKLALETAGIEDYFAYKVEQGKRYMVEDGTLYLSGMPDLKFASKTVTYFSGGRNQYGHMEGDYPNYESGYQDWRNRMSGPVDQKKAASNETVDVADPEFAKKWKARLTDDNWPSMPEWDQMTAREKAALVNVIEEVEKGLGLRGVEFHDQNTERQGVTVSNSGGTALAAVR